MQLQFKGKGPAIRWALFSKLSCLIKLAVLAWGAISVFILYHNCKHRYQPPIWRGGKLLYHFQNFYVVLPLVNLSSLKCPLMEIVHISLAADHIRQWDHAKLMRTINAFVIDDWLFNWKYSLIVAHISNYWSYFGNMAVFSRITKIKARRRLLGAGTLRGASDSSWWFWRPL